MKNIFFLSFIPFITCMTINSQTESCVPFIYENYFQNNSTSIQMTNKCINSVDKNAFKNLMFIETIDLSFNNITTLSTGLFSNLQNLKTINFQFNDITYIEEKCFVNLISLKTINLRNNNLKTLNVNIMENVIALNALYLDENPWNCDPNLCEFMYTVVSTLWQDNFAPICNSPNNTHGLSWNEVIKLSIPAIITSVERSPRKKYKKSIRHFQCHTCTQTNLLWLYDNENLTAKIFQTSNKYYTISKFKQNYNIEGKYECMIANCYDCTRSSVEIIAEPASTTTRIITWTTVIIIILCSSVYIIFFYKKSNNCKVIQNINYRTKL